MRSRSLIYTVGGLAAVAIVAAIAYWFLVLQPRGAPPASVVTATFAPTPAANSPAAAPSPAAQPSPAKPTTAAPAPSLASTPAFDVVRVEPSGDAVVAGRATPGAQVQLSDDGKAIGDVVANDAGQFVILPPTFSPGRHPLRLSAKAGDGAPQVSDVVVVDVAATAASVAAAPAATPAPAAAKPAAPATVAAATPTPTPTPTPAPATSVAPAPAMSPAASAASTPAAAASTPATAAKPSPPPAAPIVVTVASVRPVDPAGLEAVGSAPPGAHVRLRLNNAVLAEVVAGPDGEWRLTIERGVKAGDYVLEAAVVDAAGAVMARAESPFVYPQREAVASAAPVAPAASPSLAATSPASPVAVEPAPAAAAPAASTPAAAATVASTPVATAEPTPSPAVAAAAPTTPVASGETSQSAPAPSASDAAQPAPSAPAPAQTAGASEPPAATPSHAVVAEVLAYTVVKGDNLWDLAVKYYGDGLRYADIFSANASQIHDPNLIFVGQIFVVPGKPTANPPPAR